MENMTHDELKTTMEWFEGHMLPMTRAREMYQAVVEALRVASNYEDTGLEPEELLSATDMAKVACALYELNAYKDLGPIDRLRELAQADREGRCVVLPATTVFELAWDAGPECDMICPVSIDGEGKCDFCDHGQMFVYARKCTQELAERIGENVFLTWKEAEAVLKEKEK